MGIPEEAVGSPYGKQLSSTSAKQNKNLKNTIQYKGRFEQRIKKLYPGGYSSLMSILESLC